MKKYILSFVFLIVLTTKTFAQSHMILFFDKSISLQTDKLPEQNLATYKLLKKHCMAKKASIEVRFINSNTASIAHQLFSYEEPIFQAHLYDKDQLELQKTLHKGKVKRYRKSFAKKIVAYINHFKADSNQTHILSSLAPIAKHGNIPLKIVYISDLLESSDFRNMSHSSFSTETEAIVSAKEDFSKIKRKYIIPTSFHKDTTITCIIPVAPDNSSQIFEFVQTYWTTVFKQLSIVNTQIDFQSI